MARGKKNCPNCNTEIGVRTQLCECGYHYPSNEVRKDLLEGKKKKQVASHSSTKRGMKKCVNCGIEVGYRTQLCECGYHYLSEKIRKDLLEEKNKKQVANPSSTRKGIKKCVNCDAEIGVRTYLCKCGWHYPSGKIRKDLLEEREKKAAKVGTRKPGVKTCVNCSKEIGIRTHLCSCGWHYPSGELRKDLLEEKKTKKNKTYDTEGPGRKRCPECSLIVGGTTKICFGCSFDFMAAKVKKDHEIEEAKQKKKEKRENKDKKVDSPRTKKLLQELLACEGEVISQHLTKKEHAQRILDEDREKAKFLYKYARKHNCWAHVDWNYVGYKLGLQEEKSVEKVVVE